MAAGHGRRLQAGDPLTGIAERAGATPAQVALAWLLDRAEDLGTIPGTSPVAHLQENVTAGEV